MDTVNKEWNIKVDFITFYKFSITDKSMNNEIKRQFKRKIIVKADMKVLTGLHIGGSSAYSAIGTVDSPVIRSGDYPIIPGSSLKGKIRTLLASVRDTEAEYKDINNDTDIVKRLFGSGGGKNKDIIPTRLQFSDAYIKNVNGRSPSSLTEVKFENTIDRATCVANPRQIERVVPDTIFETVIVYNEIDPAQTREDLEALAEGMKLLQYDYLGGHGTRGYGRVSFENICIDIVNDDNTDKAETEKLLSCFNEVENSVLLHL